MNSLAAHTSAPSGGGRPWPQSLIWPLESPEALLPGREGFHDCTVPARPPEGSLPWLNSGQAVMRPKGGILLTQPLDAPTASFFRSHSRLQTPKAPHLHPWAPQTLGHSFSLPKKLLGVPPFSPRSPTLPFLGAPRGQAPLSADLGGRLRRENAPSRPSAGGQLADPVGREPRPGFRRAPASRPRWEVGAGAGPRPPGYKRSHGPAVPPAPRRRRRARGGAVASSTFVLRARPGEPGACVEAERCQAGPGRLRGNGAPTALSISQCPNGPPLPSFCHGPGH